jgi:putative SOS response-associated peptidase YedK
VESNFQTQGKITKRSLPLGAIGENFPPMCNAYTVRPKVRAADLGAKVSAEISKLPSPLVRRTGRGVVLTMTDGELVPSIMRWGFNRPFSDAINNARSDKFTSPTWAASLRSRRCVVPISTFYEWQPLPGKAKQAFEFQRRDGEWMWIAGLFEQSEEHGLCYATITTEPSAVVVPIHDRMLAILEFTDALGFLQGGNLPFEPYEGPIIANPCESPLRRKPPQGGNMQGGNMQGDLF